MSDLRAQVADLLASSRETADPTLAQDYRQMAWDLVSLHTAELRVALALLDESHSPPVRLSE